MYPSEFLPRISLRLRPETKDMVSRKAASRGISMSAVINEVIASVLASGKPSADISSHDAAVDQAISLTKPSRGAELYKRTRNSYYTDVVCRMPDNKFSCLAKVKNGQITLIPSGEYYLGDEKDLSPIDG